VPLMGLARDGKENTWYDIFDRFTKSFVSGSKHWQNLSIYNMAKRFERESSGKVPLTP
jgi:hypothetical protein